MTYRCVFFLTIIQLTAVSMDSSRCSPDPRQSVAHVFFERKKVVFEFIHQLPKKKKKQVSALVFLAESSFLILKHKGQLQGDNSVILSFFQSGTGKGLACMEVYASVILEQNA